MGVQAGIKFTPQMALFGEYNFSRLGGRWSGHEANIETTREIRIEYWQIPLLFRYNWLDIPKFYLTAGPELSLLKSAMLLDNPEINEPAGLNGDITERFKKTTIGFVLGAGVEITLTERLYGVFGVRFSYSLSDINNEKFKIPIQGNKYKGSHIYFPSLELGLGYVFP